MYYFRSWISLISYLTANCLLLYYPITKHILQNTYQQEQQQQHTQMPTTTTTTTTTTLTTPITTITTILLLSTLITTSNKSLKLIPFISFPGQISKPYSITYQQIYTKNRTHEIKELYYDPFQDILQNMERKYRNCSCTWEEFKMAGKYWVQDDKKQGEQGGILYQEKEDKIDQLLNINQQQNQQTIDNQPAQQIQDPQTINIIQDKTPLIQQKQQQDINNNNNNKEGTVTNQNNNPNDNKQDTIIKQNQNKANTNQQDTEDDKIGLEDEDLKQFQLKQIDLDVYQLIDQNGNVVTKQILAAQDNQQQIKQVLKQMEQLQQHKYSKQQIIKNKQKQQIIQKTKKQLPSPKTPQTKQHSKHNKDHPKANVESSPNLKMTQNSDSFEFQVQDKKKKKRYQDQEVNWIQSFIILAIMIGGYYIYHVISNKMSTPNKFSQLDERTQDKFENNRLIED